MIPDAFVPLSVLPLSPSGKVDRRALPVPDAEVTPDVLPEASALSQTERTLAAVWRELLGVERPGRDENFFDLGGDSFTLIRMHRRICEALGERFDVMKCFEFPTLAELAAYLDRTAAGKDPSPRPRQGRRRAAARQKALRNPKRPNPRRAR